jgi:hypothetical protein
MNVLINAPLIILIILLNVKNVISHAMDVLIYKNVLSVMKLCFKKIY